MRVGAKFGQRTMPGSYLLSSRAVYLYVTTFM